LFCGAHALSAQVKTEQIETYLGSYRYAYDKPVGTIKFIFQKAVLTREGSGKRSYKQLLIGQRGFTNADNAGKLLAIQVVSRGQTATIYPEPPGKGGGSKGASAGVASGYDGATTTESSTRRSKRGSNPASTAPQVVPAQLVNEAPSAQNATEPIGPPDLRHTMDPVRPKPLFNEQQNGGNAQGGGISLPDSATVAKNLEDAKQKVSGWRGRLWQTAQPIWEFVMWIFNSVIILLICFGGLCRYVAKTAAAESRVNRKGKVVIGQWVAGAHQNASAMLLIITWVIAIFFLIDAFMWLVYLDLPIWLLVVIWFPLLWFAEKLTSWIVPNLRGDVDGM
jgi:hypothetical protein